LIRVLRKGASVCGLYLERQASCRSIFEVRVTRIVPLTVPGGRVGGEGKRRGRWYFSSNSDIAVVRYGWRGCSNHSWMNVFARLARPLFKWNHDQVMRQGAAGTARLLNARPARPVHG
jgi:hypothetical protein